MTEVSERRITYDELRYVVVSCAACQAEITLDAKNEAQTVHMLLQSHAAVVPQCPICRADVGLKLAGALRGFLIWYRELDQSGQTVSFRLPVPREVRSEP